MISITTHSAVLSATDAPLNKLAGSGRRGAHQSGSWLAFFAKLLAFVGACVGGTYGYKAYVRRGRHGAFSAGTFGGMDFGDRSYASRRRF